jgi:hypothetical protein
MKTTVGEAVNACYYLLAEAGDEGFKAARGLINPGLAAIEIRCRFPLRGERITREEALAAVQSVIDALKAEHWNENDIDEKELPALRDAAQTLIDQLSELTSPRH